jgi:ATP-binding cassette subfamily B protein
MTFNINWKLSLVFLVAVPILGFLLYLIMSKSNPIFEKVFKLYDKLNNVVQENLRGIRVVKSYVREDYEENSLKVSVRCARNFCESRRKYCSTVR